ncbi:MAG: carboxypeptidase regulatory-like domain-containing protein, partial [bacterium]|nr:carboxypeptidase regulatory-like domain-containing protein [bacterium]
MLPHNNHPIHLTASRCQAINSKELSYLTQLASATRIGPSRERHDRPFPALVRIFGPQDLLRVQRDYTDNLRRAKEALCRRKVGGAVPKRVVRSVVSMVLALACVGAFGACTPALRSPNDPRTFLGCDPLTRDIIRLFNNSTFEYTSGTDIGDACEGRGTFEVLGDRIFRASSFNQPCQAALLVEQYVPFSEGIIIEILDTSGNLIAGVSVTAFFTDGSMVVKTNHDGRAYLNKDRPPLAIDAELQGFQGCRYRPVTLNANLFRIYVEPDIFCEYVIDEFWYISGDHLYRLEDYLAPLDNFQKVYGKYSGEICNERVELLLVEDGELGVHHRCIGDCICVPDFQGSWYTQGEEVIVTPGAQGSPENGHFAFQWLWFQNRLWPLRNPL